VIAVKGSSVSSTRQLTVGMMKQLDLAGTPKKPSSLKGTSNSRLRSLQITRGGRIIIRALDPAVRRDMLL
jgi:hypothetical protein